MRVAIGVRQLCGPLLGARQRVRQGGAYQEQRHLDEEGERDEERAL